MIPTDLKPLLPRDHSWQSNARKAAITELVAWQKAHQHKPRLLDLGCGVGDSAAWLAPYVDEWHGVDIADSQEAIERHSRGVDENRIKEFNGVDLPYESETFDMVYCRQVFEHVRYPDRLLQEIRRILKPGGVFVGSVSSLEPYHSRSYQSVTPWGFAMWMSDAKLKPSTLRPGVDAFTLMLRSGMRRSRLARRLMDRSIELESWPNLAMELLGRLVLLNAARRNRMKLQYCGHVVFVAIAED